MLVVAFPIAQGTSELFFTQDVDAGVVAYFLAASGCQSDQQLQFDLGSAVTIREVPDSAVREEPVPSQFVPEEVVREPLQHLVRELVKGSGHVRTCGKMPGRRLSSSAASSRFSFGHVSTCSKMRRRRLFIAAG